MSLFSSSCKRLLSLSLVCLLPATVVADTIDKADTAWILTATALVLMMTLPGLALFYAGLVRYKNIVSVLMQCFGLAAVISVVWAIAGYSLAFSEGNAFIGSLEHFFLAGISTDTLSGSIPSRCS